MIDYDRLMRWPFPPVQHALTRKDCILYSLGIGIGADPMDAAALRFVYEEGLLAVPTMAVVLAYPGFWIKDPATGVDWVRVVHGEQAITVHNPLPVEGALVGRTRITGIVDKGAGKGAIIYSEREVADAASGQLYATLSQSTFCRGDGGFGGPSGPSPTPHPLPDHPADEACDVPTLELHERPGSSARSSTASARSGSSATRCCANVATVIPAASRGCRCASRHRSSPERPSAPSSGAPATMSRSALAS